MLFEVPQNDLSIGCATPKKMVKKKYLEGYKANQTLNSVFLQREIWGKELRVWEKDYVDFVLYSLTFLRFYLFSNVF